MAKKTTVKKTTRKPAPKPAKTVKSQDAAKASGKSAKNVARKPAPKPATGKKPAAAPKVSPAPKPVKKVAPKKVSKSAPKKADNKKVSVNKEQPKAVPAVTTPPAAAPKKEKSPAPAKKPVAKKAVAEVSARPARKGSGGKAPFMVVSRKPVFGTAAQAAAQKNTTLTKRDIERFKKMLLDKRRSILGDMSDLEAGALGRNLQESAGDLSNMPTHPADIGSDNFEHEFSLGLLESERLLFNEINAALDRIEEGVFGKCVATGAPIGKARLEARPWSKYCIEYQRLLEKGLVRPGEDDENASEPSDEETESDEDDEDVEADEEHEEAADEE